MRRLLLVATGGLVVVACVAEAPPDSTVLNDGQSAGFGDDDAEPPARRAPKPPRAPRSSTRGGAAAPGSSSRAIAPGAPGGVMGSAPSGLGPGAGCLACPAGALCVAGACGPAPCPAGQVRCGAICADLATDPKNCGACARACSATCAGATCKAELRVRVGIDGRSDLVFQGGTLTWHHLQFDAPNVTLLNNAPWTPQFPAPGANKNCNCSSLPSPPVAPLAAVDQLVDVMIVSGRGVIMVPQQPSAANGFAFTIEFNDAPGGADTYEVVLSYLAD